jgi:hypothetical protein
MPDAVHRDSVSFGSLKRIDEFRLPVLEPAGDPKQPT